MATPAGQRDLDEHARRRLQAFRTQVVPWLESARALSGEPFRSSYRERTDENSTSFLRHGRGVSYHEFDLTMKDAAQLDVVSSLPLWLRRDGFLGWRALKRLRKRKHRFERLIASLRADLHSGFFQPYLDLIIRKD